MPGSAIVRAIPGIQIACDLYAPLGLLSVRPKEAPMQAPRQAAAVLLAVLMAAPAPALADGARAPDARTLAAMVQQHAARQDANRNEIRQALARPEVRELAGR